MMSNVAFSPTFIVVTPSSQPVRNLSIICAGEALSSTEGQFTLDDLANANSCDEITAANGGVESAGRSQQLLGMWFLVELEIEDVSLLSALVIRLAGIFQVASVLDGHLVADLGNRPVAVLENGLGDAHGCCCA